MIDQQPASVRLEILSRPELLAPVRSMVISMAERFGFDEVECGHLALAVDEALANVIRHAYMGDDAGRIWITILPIETSTPIFRIEIEDEGKPFDIESIVPRDLDEVRPGGLGVHLIREVTDRCTFERRSPRGMKLVLEKTPASPPAFPVPSSSPDETGSDPGTSHRHRN